MRAILFGVAAVGAGGAALTHGFGRSADYERDIARSPTAVYSAFSAVADAGEVSTAADVPGGSITSRVRKVEGRSIVLEALMGGKSVVRMELDFAPKAGGAATHMTADLDIDKAAIDQLDPAGHHELSHVPDFVIDTAFAKWMESNVKEIEAGRPLVPFDVASAPFQSRTAASDPGAAVAERRWEAESAQRRAVAPTASARPMSDPNAAADRYLHRDE
ncbi:MAG TPA: hypothetical protein VGD66_12730 [Allosphingosinicella sp.]|jgi:hypothetical protein